MSSGTSQATGQPVAPLSVTSTIRSGSLLSRQSSTPASTACLGSPPPTKKRKVERRDNYQKQKDGVTSACLLVEEEKLYFSKELLTAASTVWGNILSGSSKESQSEGIPLPGKNLQTVIWFLDYLYPETPFEMKDSRAAKLLPLAEEYQMALLKEKCVAELMKQANPRLEVACLAARYNLEELRSKAVESCSKSVNSSKLDEQRKDLPSCKHSDADVLVEILRKKLKNAYPKRSPAKGKGVHSGSIDTDPNY